MNHLYQYGLSPFFISSFQKQNQGQYVLARVIEDHGEQLQVASEEGIAKAQLTGKIHFSAQLSIDLPTIGDWVCALPFEDVYLIDQVLPRQSLLKRQAVNNRHQEQAIAANLDTAFIVQSADANFNINRLERFLAICLGANVTPVFILSKADTASESTINELSKQVKDRHPTLDILVVSAKTKSGIPKLTDHLLAGKTYCLVGSSGVGKSSLLNALAGNELMDTAANSIKHGKGKHTTSNKSLFRLPNGSLLIDTPGMRELGVGHMQEGINEAFAEISQLAGRCKYPDCSHSQEPGCAVLSAVKSGKLSPHQLEHYHALVKESARLSQSAFDKKKKEKALGKIYREGAKDRKRRKY